MKVPTSGEANSRTNAARSPAPDSRSTSRSVLIGAGGQAACSKSVMAANLSHTNRSVGARVGPSSPVGTAP
ncbi:hypothetical protein GCM10009663_54690 [Kitasatospora arboriphila]|uniref:Uncharacterized protein n=1 Tax=Kitasatospora arboriphila TaxID=258052 RepID=A0ABP4EI21_9ACTN